MAFTHTSPRIRSSFLLKSLLVLAIYCRTALSISAELYTSFQRYTNFSAAAYADDCPSPPYGATVVQYFDDAGTDTQATLFADSATQELVLAFRGTSTLQDFAVDFAQTLVAYESVGVLCSDCQVHEGYLSSWNAVSTSVIDALNTQLAANPGYSLVVTGHSLGASLAALSSVSLKGVSLAPTVYTFGQPRTGNPAFADLVDSVLPEGKMYRVTHANDGVPQTITVADGYRHHSTEYWEESAVGNNAQDTVQCVGQEPADCNNSELGIGIGPGGIGINAAHLLYSNVIVGNPLDGGKTACSG